MHNSDYFEFSAAEKAEAIGRGHEMDIVPSLHDKIADSPSLYDEASSDEYLESPAYQDDPPDYEHPDNDMLSDMPDGYYMFDV